MTTFDIPKFIAVDFFCGAGGTTRGLIDAGGHVVAGVDKVGDCLETYVKNNVNADGTNAAFLQRDIFKKSDDYADGQQAELIDDLRASISSAKAIYPDAPTLFAICAPCQPFTTIARNKLTDKRSEGRARDRDLLTESLVFIDEFQPEMILCENVQGIQNPKNGGAWNRFRQSLEERGYITGSTIADTSKFQIPQMRKRAIMLAIHRSCYNGSMSLDKDGAECLDMPLSDGTGVTRTVWEAIGHLPRLSAGGSDPSVPNHVCSDLSEINVKRLAMLKPGQSNIAFMGTDVELKCHVRLRAKGKENKTGFSDSYTRMDGSKPSPTITTKCFSFSNGRYGHPDVTQMRAISVREAAAIQTFPDNYRFYANSIQKASKMVGNAVPPKLAAFFAKTLISLYAGRSENFKD